MSFVAKELAAKARLYEERNKIYGDNYKRFGMIMSLILEGQSLDATDAQQMNRLGILVQLVAKMTRYGENFERGGHDDSLDDLAVYAMMLKELDREAGERQQEIPFELEPDWSKVWPNGHAHPDIGRQV
jgi:hypothetical protein